MEEASSNQPEHEGRPAGPAAVAQEEPHEPAAKKPMAMWSVKHHEIKESHEIDGCNIVIVIVTVPRHIHTCTFGLNVISIEFPRGFNYASSFNMLKDILPLTPVFNVFSFKITSLED